VYGVDHAFPRQRRNGERELRQLECAFTSGIPSGTDGIRGLPGEMRNADLAAAITETSNNTNAVATPDTPFSNDPPTLADIEVLRAKVNELVLALRR